MQRHHDLATIITVNDAYFIGRCQPSLCSQTASRVNKTCTTDRNLQGNAGRDEYRVTGSADWLGNWAADFEGGVMSDLGNGSYQIVFPGVAAGDYELKVTKNGSWDENWGVGGMNGGNVQFSAAEGQTVIVTFTSATGAIDVAVTGGESNPESGDLSVAALAIAMMAATAGVVVLTKKKEF